MGRADVKTLIRLWNSGEWVPGIVADICDQHASPSIENAARILHPHIDPKNLTVEEMIVISEGFELWAARKKTRRVYDDWWQGKAA